MARTADSWGLRTSDIAVGMPLYRYSGEDAPIPGCSRARRFWHRYRGKKPLPGIEVTATSGPLLLLPYVIMAGQTTAVK